MADTLIPVVASYNGTDVVGLRELAAGESLVVTGYKETMYTVAATGATETVSLSNGSMQLLTLDQACTITLPVTVAGQSFTLILTGNYAPTWAAGSGRTLKWAGGSAPTRTASAGKYDVYVFFAVDSTDTMGVDGGRNI